MTTAFDVAVVGAGSLGASTAYHLATFGVSVCVLDQFDIASQTSPQAAGLSTSISRNIYQGPIAQLSREMILRMGMEVGHDVDYVTSGAIRLTRRAELVGNVLEEIENGRRQQVSVEAIDERRAISLAPFLDATKAVALTYTPVELYLPDPGQLARAYLQGASERGARIETGCRVGKIEFSGHRVTHVKAGDRSISIGTLVLCANAGNGRLAEMLGCRLPTVPMRHQLCITQALDNVAEGHPQVKVVDGRLYVRPHGNRLLIGGFEPDPVLYTHEEADSTDIRRLKLDSTPLRRLIDGVTDVFPGLAGASISELRGGIISMTPDGRFILDRIPGFTNAWIVGGDNAGGNTTSPMIGKAMSEWICKGSPPIDLSGFSMSRFDASREDIRRQALEQYVNMIAWD